MAVKDNCQKRRMYSLWHRMISRCHNPSDKEYIRYGARGIEVCKRWHNFKTFYADMGNRPKGLSLERIDNNKNYSPSNCRWASPKEQASNKINTIRVTYNNRVWTLRELADTYNLDRGILYRRIKAGWDKKYWFIRPNKKRQKRIDKNTAKKIFNAEGPHQQIADKFGVSYSTVFNIKNKKTWKAIHDIG